MKKSDSLLKFEDEQNPKVILKQEITMKPKMEMGSNLPPFLGGNANMNMNPLGHDRLQENTMDQMQPHTQQPLLQNQQGVLVTPELITKILKDI